MSAPKTTRIQDLMELELMSEQVKAETRKSTQLRHSESLRQSEEQKRATFVMFDPDDTGSVPASDLPLLLRAMNINLSDASLKELVAKYDSEQDSRISLSEFNEILKDSAVPKNSTEEATDVFNLIDFANGEEINEDNLREALEAADARVSAEEIREVLKYCDVDGDGKIKMGDWLAVMDFVNKIEA